MTSLPWRRSKATGQLVATDGQLLCELRGSRVVSKRYGSKIITCRDEAMLFARMRRLVRALLRFSLSELCSDIDPVQPFVLGSHVGTKRCFFNCSCTDSRAPANQLI